MAAAVTRTIEMFEKEGLDQSAARFLEKYPDCVDHLTVNELREQIIMHPDARPRRRARR